MSSRKVYTEDDVPNMLDDDLDLGEIFFRGVTTRFLQGRKRIAKSTVTIVKLMKLIALICTI